MDCERLRDLFLMGEESPFRAHAADCPSCREWLEREERLLGLLKGLRDEAARAVSGVTVRAGRRRRFRPVLAAGAAAAVVLLVLGIFYRADTPGRPGLVVTRVIISGRVSDDTSPPVCIEIDGKEFPVQRVSQDAGVWRAEVEVSPGKREFLLTARDATGNSRSKVVRILE